MSIHMLKIEATYQYINYLLYFYYPKKSGYYTCGHKHDRNRWTLQGGRGGSYV
jgi:hypothetical protein